MIPLATNQLLPYPVLPEQPNRLVQAWWNRYCPYALRKHFHALRAYGHWLPPAPNSPPPPTLYLANHLSFWDGIAINYALLFDRHHTTFRVMVDEEQVRAHPFFRRIGAFSVDRKSPRDALRACAHAASLLNSGHPVLLFPQGSIRPLHEPLHLERGFTYILDRAPTASVVILTLAYEFWEDQRPELLLHASPPLPGQSTGLNDTRARFAEGLEALRSASLTRNPGRVVLHGRRGIQSIRFPGT